jgi:hypothetical protein
MIAGERPQGRTLCAATATETERAKTAQGARRAVPTIQEALDALGPPKDRVDKLTHFIGGHLRCVPKPKLGRARDALDAC